MTIPLPPGVHDLGEDEPEIEAVSEIEGDSAVDPESIKRKRKRAQRQLSDKEQFWHGVLATEIGRAVIWELLQKAGTFTYPSGVTPAGFPDTMALGFALGRKSIGDALYHMLAALDRVAVLKIHDEHDPSYISIAKTKGYR